MERSLMGKKTGMKWVIRKESVTEFTIFQFVIFVFIVSSHEQSEVLRIRNKSEIFQTFP